MQAYNVIRNLYVRTNNKAAVEHALQRGIIDNDDYMKILGQNPPTKSLDEVKTEKIVSSKMLLSEYLDSHPLQSECHGGKTDFYTVTEDKQNMFSRKFSAHMALVQAGIKDTMTWNAAGKPCEEWTDAECIQFIAETNAYVTPLVSYQQHIEMDILACATIEEVDAIVIDYASLFTTEIPSGGDEVAQ